MQCKRTMAAAAAEEQQYSDEEPQNTITTEELYGLATGAISDPPLDLILRFAQTEDGKALFYNDRKLLRFISSLSMGREAQIASNIPEVQDEIIDENNEDDWESDDDDEYYSWAKNSWERLSQKKRDLVVNHMRHSSVNTINQRFPKSPATVQQVWKHQSQDFHTYENSQPKDKNNLVYVCNPPGAASSSTIDPASGLTESINDRREAAHQPLRVNASQEEKCSSSSLGLFTQDFNWSKLPPSLREVYDKQGHRQEVIDGPTFWRFLTKCTVAKEQEQRRRSTQDDSTSTYSDNNDEEIEEDAKVPTDSQLLHLLRSVVGPVVDGDQMAAGEEHQIDNVALSHPQHHLTQASRMPDNQEQNDDDNDDEAIRMLQTLIASFVANAETNEVPEGGQGGAGGPGGQGEQGGAGGAGEVYQSTLQHTTKLRSIVSERRSDPDRQHLADLWEDLLQKGEEEEDNSDQQDVYSHRRSGFFGLRSRLAAWRQRRKARKLKQSVDCSTVDETPVEIVLDRSAASSPGVDRSSDDVQQQ